MKGRSIGNHRPKTFGDGSTFPLNLVFMTNHPSQKTGYSFDLGMESDDSTISYTGPYGVFVVEVGGPRPCTVSTFREKGDGEGELNRRVGEGRRTVRRTEREYRRCRRSR